MCSVLLMDRTELTPQVQISSRDFVLFSWFQFLQASVAFFKNNGSGRLVAIACHILRIGFDIHKELSVVD